MNFWLRYEIRFWYEIVSDSIGTVYHSWEPPDTRRDTVSSWFTDFSEIFSVFGLFLLIVIYFYHLLFYFFLVISEKRVTNIRLEGWRYKKIRNPCIKLQVIRQMYRIRFLHIWFWFGDKSDLCYPLLCVSNPLLVIFICQMLHLICQMLHHI